MKRIIVVLAITGLVASIAVTAAVAKSARSSAKTQVCVLLPDTKSSVRWEQFDKPSFANALKKAGVTATIVNALNDPQKQLSQAEQCISDGAKVGIITSLDTGTSIAIQKKFTAAGGKTIDYDRQIVGGTGSVYVSFDGNAVGRQQALGVIAGMKANGTYKSDRRRRPALGRPDRRERVLVQERQRRHPEPALQEERCEEGPGEVRARVERQERSDDLRADARPDEQQHPGRASRRTTTSPARSSPP